MDPDGHHLYTSQQYSRHILLHFFVKEKNVKRNDIMQYYFTKSAQMVSPQKYLFQTLLGEENMRNWFSEWAVRTAARIDYVSRDLYRTSVAHAGNIKSTPYWHPYVWEAQDSGTNGWIRPHPMATPRGWSYNVWRISVTKNAKYM